VFSFRGKLKASQNVFLLEKFLLRSNAIIFKETVEMEISNDIKNSQQPDYRTRVLLVALLYPISFLLLLFIPDTGETSETLIELLMTVIPSVIIVLLIPVVIRGSAAQKIMAAVLLLPAVWFGFLGWENAIERFSDYHFRH
jgi:hypothetical protein